MKFFSNFIFMLKKMWNFNKILFWGKFVIAILDGFLAPLSAYIVKILIDNAVDGNFGKAMFFVGVLAFINLLFLILNATMTRSMDVVKDLFHNNLVVGVSSKAVNMDYKLLFTPKMMRKRKMAGNVADNNIAIGHVDAIFSVLSSVISIISVGYLLSSVSFWVYIVMFFLCGINIFAMIIERKTHVAVMKEASSVNVTGDYYVHVLTDEDYANDMRMYSVSEWIVSKYMKLMKNLNCIFKKLYNKIYSTSVIQAILNTLENIFLYSFAVIQIVFFGMSFANFSLLISALHTFSSSVSSISNNFITIAEKNEYVQDFRDFMEAENEIAVDNVGLPFNTVKEIDDLIELKNVTFAYPNIEEPTLKNVGLTIEKGKFYVIVGENGAGKTTLCRLICRLYDVSDGELLYCGKNIKDIDYKGYRNNIGIVFQDYKYYCLSIAENVAMNEYDESEEVREKIKQALIEAGLGEKISSLPKGIDTQLGKIFDEEGILLSGGELQKLALARVLFKNPSLVILDEPSSALDAYAEDELIQTFNKVLKGKTVLYISHRMSVAKYSDGVIYINGGEIKGFGSHKELMETVPEYHNLYEAQAKHYR